MNEDMPLSAVLQELEWRKCAPQDTNDPDKLMAAFVYFCENYWFIKHPGQGRIKFEMFDAQKQSVYLWLTSRYSIMLKARQVGFSTLLAAFCFWLTFFYEDRSIIMLSRTERDAIKLLSKAKYGYKFLPEWMKFRGPPQNQTMTRFEFANESYIESLPSMSDPARGESVYLAVIDEMAFLPNSEEAWASIEPTVDVGGRVITLSTANGEGNLFHKLWVGAETRTNRFRSMFHPWSVNGRDQEWYDEKAKDLPEWQMAQEYPDNPDDAFLKSGRPVFSLKVLHDLDTWEPMIEGFFDPAQRFAFQQDHEGPCRIWEWPKENGRYALGADVAEGLEHGDFSSVHVINARDGEVVATWHGRIDPDLLGSEVIAPMGRMYNTALVGVESNNQGLVTLKALQRARYHPLYMQRSPRYKKSIPTDILGWRTTQVTKPLAVLELNGALREGAVRLHDPLTVAELRTFVRGDNNKMMGSPFDDRTMSLAIANQMLKHVWLKEYQPKKEPGPGTMGYFEKQLYGDDVFEKIAPASRVPRGLEPIGSQFVRNPTRI